MITHVPCGGSNSDPAGRLLIKAKQDTIDGVGGTLGFAYSDYVWNDCPGITLSGVMKFDVDDLGELSTTELDLLYLHEMGHVIGIGYVQTSSAINYEQVADARRTSAGMHEKVR